MKFISKHISTIVGLMVFILVFVGFFMVKDVFNTDESTAIYGNRIEGKSKLEISNDTMNAVKEKAKDKSKSTKVRVAGKIVEISIDINDGVSRDDAKALANTTLECFSKEEKDFYDIQFFITCTSNPQQFPIIGYKHRAMDGIAWTRDRTVE